MDLETILDKIIQNPPLHTRWLNTLSYLENCGARKIAATEHPTLVKQEMLKHAAEEFRHALYLKQQLIKIPSPPPADYALSTLLGGLKTKNYLNQLEVMIARNYTDFLYERVTYAIEKRAEGLYPLYQNLLKKHKSKISVHSIIKEEEGHLREMEELLPNDKSREHVLSIEKKLFTCWLKTICAHLQPLILVT
ncbi:MAG: hypothetical protein S4CHLAM123_15770 [Chlamydiales bacterium]|nr:hypothetical protein [Chlamydiales bacterium]